MNILLIISLTLTLLILHCCNSKHLDHHSENFYQDNKNHKSVQDILHYITPRMSDLEYAPDVLVVLVFAYMMIMKYQLFNQFFGLWITVMLVREFIVRLTVLPKHKLCKVEDQNTLRGGCYDKIFSGHFAIIFAITLLLLEKSYIFIYYNDLMHLCD